MDAYVYLRQVSPASLHVLVDMLRADRTLSDEERAKGAIRAVGQVTGEYDAVAFVEAETIEGILGVQQRIRSQTGVPFTETALALAPPSEIQPPCRPNPEQPPPQPGDPPPLTGPEAPKRRQPLNFDMLINVKAKPGLADKVFRDFFCKLPGNPIGPGLQGEARTTGRWDMKVEVAADTYERLCDFIDRVMNDPDVAETEVEGMVLLS